MQSYIVPVKGTTGTLHVSNDYLNTRSINFCVMPPVCAQLHISFEDDAFYLLPVLPIETCIFPRLQSLTTVLDPARNLHLFLSPTLRRCAIPDIHPDLKSIATRCATLEDLSIKSLSSFHSTTDELSSFHSTADELSLLSDSIHLYKRLVTLSCPPLDWAAWEHLFSLPTLLTVAIEGRDLRPLDRDNFIVTLSLNITVLSFRVETAAYVTAVMQNSEFPSLKEFKIGVDGLLQVDAEQLFRALLQCKACQTLEHISIWSYQNVVREPPSSSFAAITQLVYFTQLRTLRLAFPHCCINLDNDLLFAAMSSWPHIRSLELSDSPHRTVTITFRGLFAALRQCPHLHTLELSIDAVNIDIDPTLESFQHTSLQKFCVGCAQVVDTEAVARIVSSMLPCVDTDGFSYFCVSGLRHKWSTIYSHLTRLKSSAVRNRNITEAAAET
ncbi:hypothetical protein DFH29DRAFT_295919 [Suillus ampliporus]|nr:hypothetical protein DFH29DRAFT_295919 [Suillus ampliporus]